MGTRIQNIEQPAHLMSSLSIMGAGFMKKIFYGNPKQKFIMLLFLGAQTIIFLSCAGVSKTDKIFAIADRDKAQSISQYDMFELSFEYDGICENKFFDIVIKVKFISPGGAQYDVKGFYYGHNYWKVRFSPEEIGNWTYSFLLSSKEGFQKEGVGGFKCTPGDQEGPVIRHPENPFRFIFATGRPYYPIGLQDCFYVDGSRLDDILIDELHGGRLVSVDDFFFIYGQAGFNLLRFSQNNCSYALYDDLDHFLEAESIATDRLLALARKHAFHVMFGFFGFHEPQSDILGKDSLITANDLEIIGKEKRFIDYCIARWGGYVDFWELLNERSATDEWTTIMANYARATDPYQKPISTSWEKPDLPAINIMAPHWYESEDIFLSDLQTEQMADMWKQWGKPVIVSEQGNKGTSWDLHSGERMRIRTWTALFKEISFIFWHTGSMYLNDEAANIYLGPEERRYIRVLRDFSFKLDSEVRMIPVEVSAPDRVRVFGLRSSTVAAAYLHHFDNHITAIKNIKISLDLPAASRKKEELMAEWIDPSTGKIIFCSQISVGQRVLDVPDFTVDLALIITIT